MTKQKPKAVKSINHVNGLTVWGIPPKLRAAFKSACARKNVPMRRVIMDFMETFSKN